MKQLITALTLCSAALAIALPAKARDTKLMLPIAAALETADAKAKLDPSIQLFFGNTATPKVLQKLGSDTTSKKTNAFGKNPETSCNRAFLSGMLALQKRAHELGANAVINITSNYQHVEFSSVTEYECHDGAIMSGAAFKAEYAKIESK